MPRVLQRPLAAADIAEIWGYIAEDSLEQADAWVDRPDETLQLLATQRSWGEPAMNWRRACAACRSVVT